MQWRIKLSVRGRPRKSAPLALRLRESDGIDYWDSIASERPNQRAVDRVSLGRAAPRRRSRTPSLWQRTTIPYFTGAGALVAGLALWVTARILGRTGGIPAAPLDDAYIHFQFARSFADLKPLVYSPGTPPVGGATSLLWPGVLAPLFALGMTGSKLVWAAWMMGWLALGALAWEVWRAAEPWLQRWAAWGAVVGVALFPGYVWFAASGMEVVPLAWLLVRAARRSAEWVEESCPSRGHAVELYALALAGPLLRPEGLIASILVAAALFVTARGTRRLRALIPLCAIMVPPAVYWLVTGSATSTTALTKWLPLNPYYDVSQVTRRIGDQVSTLFFVLLDGRGHSAAFLPAHTAPIAWLALPAIVVATKRRGQLTRGLMLAAVGLGILIPTTYETFLWNRLRYLWPFLSIWILGSAALFDLVGGALARIHRALRWLTPVLAGAMVVSLAWKLPVIVGDIAVSAWAILHQQVALGKWANGALPEDAIVGVNDAGAIAYFSDRSIFDIVGLVTESETLYWLAGAGSRFEHYERLERNKLPTHFIVYPRWMGIPQLLGKPLAQRRVRGATILGSSTMIAYTADYSLLGSGELPTTPTSGELLDLLDVSDLVSEQEHGYALFGARASDNVVFTSESGALADAGRRGRAIDQFELSVEGSGTLVARLLAKRPVRVTLSVDGHELAERLVGERWQEVSWTLPEELSQHTARVEVRTRAGRFVSLHYWAYGARVP